MRTSRKAASHILLLHTRSFACVCMAWSDYHPTVRQSCEKSIRRISMQCYISLSCLCIKVRPTLRRASVLESAGKSGRYGYQNGKVHVDKSSKGAAGVMHIWCPICTALLPENNHLRSSALWTASGAHELEDLHSVRSRSLWPV